MAAKRHKNIFFYLIISKKGDVRAERAFCSIYLFGTPVKSAIARNYRSFNRAGGFHGFHGLGFLARRAQGKTLLSLARSLQSLELSEPQGVAHGAESIAHRVKSGGLRRLFG